MKGKRYCDILLSLIRDVQSQSDVQSYALGKVEEVLGLDMPGNYIFDSTHLREVFFSLSLFLFPPSFFPS